MGREAVCHCTWGSQEADCKVLLETDVLIVRGSIKRRVVRASLTDVATSGDQLTFRTGEECVSLHLGADLARKWAMALSTPAPTLARKLGISKASHLLLLGECEALKPAIAEAGSTEGSEVNLILACVRTQVALDRVLDQYQGNAPIWIVYPKGPGHGISEAGVRSALRSRGFIDTKVASVSEEMTALRFHPHR